MKMEVTRSPITLVTSYEATQCRHPKGLEPNLHRREILKSQMKSILCVLLADSDYQLVSEAQTPGLNNQTPPELPSYDEHPKRNNVSRNGDLFENYKNNRDRYPPSGHPVSSMSTKTVFLNVLFPRQYKKRYSEISGEYGT
jgi:hypothetical protein